MKIAFIVGQFPELSLTFILNQITGLIDLGHEVDIYSCATPIQKSMHPDIKKYRLYDRTFYLDKVPHNRLKRVFYALKLLIFNFHKEPFTLLNSLNIFRYGKDALSLYQFCHTVVFLRKKYDIIHCHFGTNGNFGARLKKIGIKGKLVVTFHAYELSALLALKGFKIYKKLFLVADLIMPISNFWKAKLLEIGCPEKKIFAHHMGVDINLFKFTARSHNGCEPIQLLSVGRLIEKKGIEFGIRAVAKIKNKHPKLTMNYIIIGDGELKEQLEILIKKLGVSDTVKILGSKIQNEVQVLMMQSHIFLLPSITARNGDMEGIPVVLMEAAASGLPVVSTWHSGIPELIQDGKSGFLVSERDIDALVDRLLHLIEHPEVWPEMGRAGREFVEKHYDIKKLNKKLEQIYEKLLLN